MPFKSVAELEKEIKGQKEDFDKRIDEMNSTIESMKDGISRELGAVSRAIEAIGQTKFPVRGAQNMPEKVEPVTFIFNHSAIHQLDPGQIVNDVNGYQIQLRKGTTISVNPGDSLTFDDPKLINALKSLPAYTAKGVPKTIFIKGEPGSNVRRPPIPTMPQIRPGKAIKKVPGNVDVTLRNQLNQAAAELADNEIDESGKPESEVGIIRGPQTLQENRR